MTPKLEETYKCGVCEARTLNRQHYGAVVCNSCRIFFRRGVYKVENWRCSGKKSKGNCSPVTTNCKRCRFQMCLRIGMKADLVDKTKRAISEYLRQSPPSPPSRVVKFTDTLFAGGGDGGDGGGGGVVSVLDFLVKDVARESRIQTYTGQTDKENKEKQEKVVSLLQHKNPQPLLIKGAAPTVMPALSVLVGHPNLIHADLSSEEEDCLANIVSMYKDFELELWEKIGECKDCRQDIKIYSEQVKDVVARKSNRMTYNPFIENAFHKQVNANFWRYIHSHCPSLNKDELSRFSREMSSYTVVYDLFLSYTIQDTTVREFYREIGIDASKPPVSTMMPDWMVDVKLPSVLHSSLFVSPWAESIELEEFFMNTASAFRQVMQDPIIGLLSYDILLLNCATDIGLDAKPMVSKGKIMTLMFKHLLKKLSGDSSRANQILHRITQIHKDIKVCKSILHSTCFIKTTQPVEEEDLDAIEVQDLSYRPRPEEPNESTSNSPPFQELISPLQNCYPSVRTQFLTANQHLYPSTDAVNHLQSAVPVSNGAAAVPYDAVPLSTAAVSSTGGEYCVTEAVRLEQPPTTDQQYHFSSFNGQVTDYSLQHHTTATTGSTPTDSTITSTLATPACDLFQIEMLDLSVN